MHDQELKVGWGKVYVCVYKRSTFVTLPLGGATRECWI